MKPTKQTVYLPVNGETEFIIAEYENGAYVQGIKEIEGYFFTSEQLNEYTSNIIKQALETAAESKSLETAYTEDGLDYKELRLSKQSITNTFDETFKKFEV